MQETWQLLERRHRARFQKFLIQLAISQRRQHLRKRYYIMFVARDADGKLLKIPIPLHYLYVFVVGAVVGMMSITGMAGSYTRMLMKTLKFNELRNENQTLSKNYKSLEKVAKGLGLQVEGETIARSDDLAPALRRVLQRGELLFALPDPEVYNKATLHNILLSTYHSNEPVIAFSPAYVKAGALAAVFSSPPQVARQVSEYLLQVPAGAKILLPPPQHPKHFSVDVNRHVARSLGIVVASDAMLEERLRKADGAQP